MIISFCGAEGAGKSSVAKKLAKKLGWPRYYIGGLRRQKAKQKGMSLEEYNKLGEKDPSTDLEVDKYQEKLGKTEDNFIIEGRTSWYFIPHSFKIFLDVDPKVGAQRVWKALQEKNDRNEGNISSVEEMKKSLQKRKESDKLRYKKYFDIDVYNKSHYDLVIDTTKQTVNETFDLVYKIIKKKLQNK